MADVYLTHTEAAAENFRFYGNPKDADVASMTKSYKQAINLILSSGSIDVYKIRLEDLIQKVNIFYWIVSDIRAYYNEMIIIKD